MAYKIAVASSDGIMVNQTFGAAQKFLIVEVDDAKHYSIIETRYYDVPEQQIRSCCSGAGRGNRCNSEGYGISKGNNPKVSLIDDCRCLICTKVGFQIQKEIEKKTITSFEVDCKMKKALDKIVAYLYSVDNHTSLRGTAQGNR